MLERPPKELALTRDDEKHVELSLDAGQSFYSLALFSVDMYFRANVTNPEGSQFCQSGGVPILPTRRGPNFANPEGSNFANLEGSDFANPAGSYFCQSEGSCFCQSGGSCFCQSGGVLFLPIQRGPVFTNPAGSCFCQSGEFLLLSIRRGISLSRLNMSTEKKAVKEIRLLRDRLGTSDCTGFCLL